MKLRPEVQAFAEQMEARLRANDHKGGWRKDSPAVLLARLRANLTSQPSAEDCIDVANYALMLADLAGAPPALQHQEVPCGNTPYDEGPFTIATDCGQEVPREPVAWQCACGESTRAGWTHRRGWCNEGGLAEFETAASPSTTRQQEVGSFDKTGERINALAKEAGFHMEPMTNMLYTVRGNHAQLVNFARLVLAAAPSTPEKAGGVPVIDEVQEAAYQRGKRAGYSEGFSAGRNGVPGTSNDRQEQPR